MQNFLIATPQIQEVRNQISKLEKQKKECQKKIAKHEERAYHWQFNKDNSLERRREYMLAQNLNDQIHLIDLKIQSLKQEEEELVEMWNLENRRKF